jgi:hypothetical protein
VPSSSLFQSSVESFFRSEAGNPVRNARQSFGSSNSSPEEVPIGLRASGYTKRGVFNHVPDKKQSAAQATAETMGSALIVLACLGLLVFAIFFWLPWVWGLHVSNTRWLHEHGDNHWAIRWTLRVDQWIRRLRAFLDERP